jgi:hypothetical protein
MPADLFQAVLPLAVEEAARNYELLRQSPNGNKFPKLKTDIYSKKQRLNFRGEYKYV